MNTKGAELIFVKCTLCVKHSAHHKSPLRLGFQMIEIETERVSKLLKVTQQGVGGANLPTRSV